jgi:heme/copper-type cytochrome/quinol oxidase subunit 2
MKINYKKSLAFITSFSLLIGLPFFVSYAAGGAGGTTIQNPLGPNNMEVKDLLVKIMDLVATVGGIVVVFMIIYSGYMFVAARGNDSKISEAKDILLATVIGGAILLGADIIANVVVNTVKCTTGAPGCK